MKKFRWTDWLAGVALVLALSAFAGAENVDGAVAMAQLR